VALNRSGRRRTSNPYTSSVLDKTISNVFNESLSTSIAYDMTNIPPTSGIYVALQNNRTNVSSNTYAPFNADKESPVRGVIQFDLEHPLSGISANETVGQAVLFLKVKDVSPAWPGYNLDLCLMQPQGVSIGTDATWLTCTGATKWDSSGIVPQVGVGYSLKQTDDTPFDVDGYYPLYLTKYGAIKKSPTPTEARTEEERLKGWIGYHEHTFNDTVYYMPNGLAMLGKQYHGSYERETTPSTQTYGYNEYATEDEARLRAIDIGCLGFHTIVRNGKTIYKPCVKSTITTSTRTPTTSSFVSNVEISVESSLPTITTSAAIGDSLSLLSGNLQMTPQGLPATITQRSSSLTIGGGTIKDTDLSDVEVNVVDFRFTEFTSGGGTVAKNVKNNQIRISKLVPRTIRKEAFLIADITPLVEAAIARNERYLPILIKGTHGPVKNELEAKPNATVGPQDQYVSFYSFNTPRDNTIFKGEFNTSRTRVTGTMTVDLYTSDKNSSVTSAYIMRPTAGTPTKTFNDFFATAVSGDNVGIETGKVDINDNTRIDLKNKTLTVEGYNKDYIQFQNNPIAGATPGTYTNIQIKLNKTEAVNEIELIASSSGKVVLPFKAYEPFTIDYHGTGTGSNNLTTFTPTKIENRNGNTVVTVKETLTEELHVDQTDGVQFHNLADAPRLKIYYRTRR
jgi:hypothetical protein